MRGLSRLVNQGRPDQRGAVLIGVMVVVFSSMMLVGILVDEYLGVEVRAVERNLASVRAQWALSGHLDYVLSRARNHADLTGYTDQDDLRNRLNGFDDDLPADVYQYPSAGQDDYLFQVDFQASDQDAPALAGRVSLALDLVEVGGVVPVLQGISGREPGLTVLACIGSLPVTQRTALTPCLVGAGGLDDTAGVATVISYETR